MANDTGNTPVAETTSKPAEDMTQLMSMMSQLHAGMQNINARLTQVEERNAGQATQSEASYVITEGDGSQASGPKD